MRKTVKFQALENKNKKFDFSISGTDITPLSVGDAITVPSKMSNTGFVRFQVTGKHVFLDTRQGEWEETTTLTGVFMIVEIE